MKTTLRFSALIVGILLVQVCMAQAPAGAPSGATGLCNDGTYYTGATKQGACRGHKGVKDWYGAPAATPAKSGATPAASSAAAAPPPATAAPAAKPAAKTNASAPAAKSATSATAAAPGGGPGLVWVNTPTNVYHCPGTQYYGKTKTGAYMTEADAKAKGARPDHGKACN
jgi:hypothetical protein